MAKTVKVLYNADTLETAITVDGREFDTSRINGKEIEDWAYPFMIRKVRWNGFYDEMVEALGGDKEFNLVFEGSEDSLAELKEALEDAPVTIISDEDNENIVVIEYDEDSLTTSITINGQDFDTSRIDGKEIADWIYPFIIRKVKWDGIFDEISKVIGSDEYTVQFSGSNSAMRELMEECPETVSILKGKKKSVKTKSETQATASTFYNDYDYLNSLIGDVSIDSFISAWERPDFYYFTGGNQDDIIGVLQYNITMFLYYNAVYDVLDNYERSEKPNHHLARAIVISSEYPDVVKTIGADTDRLTEIYFQNDGSPLYLANRFKMGYFFSGDFDNSLKYYQEAYNHSDFYSYEWEHDRYIAHHILGENVEDYIENYI